MKYSQSSLKKQKTSTEDLNKVNDLNTNNMNNFETKARFTHNLNGETISFYKEERRGKFEYIKESSYNPYNSVEYKDEKAMSRAIKRLEKNSYYTRIK